jgi:secreted PhoX family phosphatase
MDHMQLSRRSFLAYLGSGAVSLAAASTGLFVFANEAEAAQARQLYEKKTAPVTGEFASVAASKKDDLQLPKGFRYDVIAAYGDPINERGDTFGYDSAFTCFFPLNGSNVHGLLWIGHDSAQSSLLRKGASDSAGAEQTRQMLYEQGGTILEVYRGQDGTWRADSGSVYARRVTGLDRIELTGPARSSSAVANVQQVQGVIALSSGGQTLWGTVLAGERHFEAACREAGLPLNHYGWMVEVDPQDSQKPPAKHTALGRFNHGGAAMTVAKDGRLVVYMGDSKPDSCLYKYISNKPYDEVKGKANSELLTDGTLYAANLETGEWTALTIEAVQKAIGDIRFRIPKALSYTKEQLTDMFKTQSDVLVFAHEAALILGATPTDQPEEVEISPQDGTLYIAYRHNPLHGNLHGYIARVVEQRGDPGSGVFRFEIVASGGSRSGFSSPGKLAFDRDGRLWVATCVPSGKLYKGTYAEFQNNGLYVTTVHAEGKSSSFRFANAPVAAEFGGIWFTPDERTMFVSVQHPGETTTDLSKPTSRWPHRKGDTLPRPAIVAVSGFDG